jgi:hypothetical protein
VGATSSRGLGRTTEGTGKAVGAVATLKLLLPLGNELRQQRHHHVGIALIALHRLGQTGLIFGVRRGGECADVVLILLLQLPGGVTFHQAA